MKNICLFAQVVLFPFLLCAGLLLAAPADVLSSLDKNHPRLMLKDKDLQQLKEQYESDKTLQKCVQDVLAEADGYINARMLTYDKIGPRLLHVSRSCLHRIYALALAWRWTGDEKYARKAVENMLTVCAFKDWNPSHFLDTAEMSHAVGIGYDWLYSYLDGETRETIKAALIKNGLEPGLSAYKKTWWAQSEFNWNQVCNGGMIIGALAIAETDPNYAEQIIPAAIRSLPLALKSYGPDGAWGEGPGYWSYATHYTAYGIAALQSALNKDFGLLQTKGLAESGYFPIYTTGPTGIFLNFADCGERSSRRPMPCMFWLAHVYNNPLYAESEHEMIARHRASPEHMVWYVPIPPVSPGQGPGYPRREAGAARDLDRYFRGPVEVAVFRSAWDDPDALFVGVKAGYNQVNHGHLDLGNFELDALGVRWARDLGSDDYNLPGYWDGKRGGQRWSYYRLNSASHNIPMLAGENQDPQAVSSFTLVETNKEMPFVLVDLTSAYEKYARRVTRGVAMVENRRAVLVQDEFELKEPCEVACGMTTDAKTDVSQKGTAVLTLKGKELVARVLSPADAEFVVESAEQKPPQESNKGVSRLLVRLPGARGDVRIAILLSPVWKDGKSVKQVEIKPLREWEVKSHGKP